MNPLGPQTKQFVKPQRFNKRIHIQECEERVCLREEKLRERNGRKVEEESITILTKRGVFRYLYTQLTKPSGGGFLLFFSVIKEIYSVT